MRLFSDDIWWCILQHLPAAQILAYRRVAREWRDFVDSVTQEQWKRVYLVRVRKHLSVSDGFDWKCAAVVTSRNVNSVEAMCTWNFARVHVVVPWRTNGVNPPLRSGVRRKLSTVASVIDYEYNDMFLLRGFVRSCRYRLSSTPCRNCLSKQRCLVPQYDYFIRPLKDTCEHARDDCLGLLLAVNPLPSHPEEEDSDL